MPIFFAWVRTWRYRLRPSGDADRQPISRRGLAAEFVTPHKDSCISAPLLASGCYKVPSQESACASLAPQCIGWHEVDERLLAVDLDDRKQLAVARLELGVAVDRDLLELEAELVPQRRDGRPRTLAEVAALRAVERTTAYG